MLFWNRVNNPQVVPQIIRGAADVFTHYALQLNGLGHGGGDAGEDALGLVEGDAGVDALPVRHGQGHPAPHLAARQKPGGHDYRG